MISLFFNGQLSGKLGIMVNENFPKLFVVLILLFGTILWGFFSPCVAGPKGGEIGTGFIVGGPEIVLDPHPASNVV
jgi:hypothetical protein